MDPKELRGLMEAYAEMYAPQEVDEATAMAKRGLDEPTIRQNIAKSTGGGQSVDRANALANKSTFGSGDSAARQKLARSQAGDFRKTNSSNPGLQGYAYKSNDPDVKAKQAARGAQRGSAALTPNEKKKLNMGEEVEIFDTVLEFLQAEGYAETLEEAEWLMANVIDEQAIDIILGEEQLDELSVNKMLAYVEKGEKNRADLNKKWDKGTATHRERMRVLGREEGEARASDKVEKKTGKRPYEMNALDKARYAVTKEDYMDEGKLPLDKERRTKIGNQIGKRLQSSGSEIIGSGSAFMPKGIRNNLRQSAAKKVGEVKKMMGALKSAQKEEYMDEAQEARNNPEKYEREQSKKSAPVRGERTPMPPRGDKRREDFEKWYAANGPK